MSAAYMLLGDFGGVVVTCDGGKTKSTPSPTDLECTVRLDWSLTKFTETHSRGGPEKHTTGGDGKTHKKMAHKQTI